MIRHLVAISILAPISALSQSEGPSLALLDSGVWVEDPLGEPVIDRGPDGAWDHVAVDNPFVIEDDGVFYCYFEAENVDGQEQVGLATSTDLRAWTKHGENPVLPAGPAGAWDHMAAKLPVVGRHGDTFSMLYTGKDGRGNGAIGLATSEDGLSWTKSGDGPVLPGRPGLWDPILTTCPSLARRGGRYHAIYRGMTGFYTDQRLGLMTSLDLRTWRRPDEPLAGLDGIYSLATCATPIDGTYVALSQKAHVERVYLSDDLRTWQPGPEARFYPGPIDTPSAPIIHDGRLWILYEKQDRIYRARLSPASEVPSGGQTVGGRWSFEGGVARQVSTGGDWARAIVGQGTGITATVRRAEGTGWVGLHAERGEGFYCFALVHDGRDIARLFRTTSGAYGDTDWEVDVPFTPGAEHRLRLAVSGDRISCEIDGETVITMRDTTPLDPGDVGLFAAGAAAEYHDIIPEGNQP